MRTAIGVSCCLLLVFLTGCQTLPAVQKLNVGPVVPKENEQIIRDQLIILVDATGSVSSNRVFESEKALAEAFTGAMPDGTYLSGITSFAGVPQCKWLKVPLATFNRGAMVNGAADLKRLGSLTPLARAIRSLKPELAGKGGRGALLIFSDGRPSGCPKDVLAACQELKAAHGDGKLCIFTVWMGACEKGKKLMQDMATVNGCGEFYEGASLNSAAAIEALVRRIFFGPKEVVKPAPKPAPWTLKIINFDNDSAVVAASYDAQLDEAAAIMKANPGIRVLLQGHTDSNASNKYNQGLSERRVEAVKAAFVKRGIDAGRFEGKAYGEEKPAVANDTKEHRHANRRVELSVL